ncbi:hypothetical protein M8C13_10300 [Crossiella sp. SN42]|uniref:hypothetical protein n=1 Tax=Crossiella sp. SN42 TaxID=2944808 RepID=UPI00207D4E9B|nr:hypothetical protein [Crossiella sp. SN42]MCO1576146.1 hypothetical protein [Crossiella sp. SN42]
MSTLATTPISLSRLIRGHLGALRAHRAGQLALLLPALLGTAVLIAALANISVIDAEVQRAAVTIYLGLLALLAPIAGAVLAVDPWARRGVAVVLGVSSDRGRWLGAQALSGLLAGVLGLGLATALGGITTAAFAAADGQAVARLDLPLLTGFAGMLLSFAFGFVLGAATRSVLFTLLIALALPLLLGAVQGVFTASPLLADIVSWLNVNAAFDRLFTAGPLPLWQAIVISVLAIGGPLAIAVGRTATADLR